LGKATVIPDPEVRPTIKPQEAFRLLGCGQTNGYEQIRQGTFPVPVLRLGRVIKIPTAPLLELLGLRAPAGVHSEAEPPANSAA
jgi:predicted DNA-binding transcriptional regulator AlpA